MNGASNYPYRGDKNTNWEGGCRSPTFVHAPALLSAPAARQELHSYSPLTPKKTANDPFQPLSRQRLVRYFADRRGDSHPNLWFAELEWGEGSENDGI